MKPTTYTATISHHSIARAPEITVTGPIAAAKRAATKRFGNGFLDHIIKIFDDDVLVAYRRVGDSRWTNA